MTNSSLPREKCSENGLQYDDPNFQAELEFSMDTEDEPKDSS